MTIARASRSDVRCDSCEWGSWESDSSISLTCMLILVHNGTHAGRGVRGFIVCDVH